MKYPENTHHWQEGDLVIHHADAKQVGMLMIVIGYDKRGLVKTRYVDPKRSRKNYLNELRFLLDPQTFGITTCSAVAEKVHEFYYLANDASIFEADVRRDLVALLNEITALLEADKTEKV